MPTALVTGSLGFVASYLIPVLDKAGIDVWGFDLRQGQDLRDYEEIRRTVEECVPDYVYHLGAQTWPKESITDPRRALDVNITGALNLLEALRHTGSSAKILLAGTSEEYGYETHGQYTNLTEDTLCCPTTPYGVSKLAQTQLGLSYARQYGLNVVCTRAFNHTGAGQPPIYAVPSFAKRVAQAEKTGGKVTHGNLSAVRNYTHVRDVVRAYTSVIDAEPGIYNVCSENNVTIQTVLDMLIGFTDNKVEAEFDPKLAWGSTSNVFPRPSYEKIHEATGWYPSYSLEETLLDVLDFWRAREGH
jgi:GDP-4-dehydro-6-deoxy-D-mannose reductase